MMTSCENCGAVMRPLFTGVVCSAECDLPKPPMRTIDCSIEPVSLYGDTSLHTTNDVISAVHWYLVTRGYLNTTLNVGSAAAGSVLIIVYGSVTTYRNVLEITLSDWLNEHPERPAGAVFEVRVLS